MWWKIYFWLSVIEGIIGALSIFFAPGIHIVTQVSMELLFLIAVTGLYTYVFQRSVLSELFWQYLFGIYLLVDSVYLIYAAFPDAPLLSLLSFLSIYKVDSMTFINAVIGVILDIPLLYALFRVSQGKVYAERTKKKAYSYHWGMLQTALWGYSTVLTFFLFLLSLLPSKTSQAGKDHTASYGLSFIFAPLFLFWLWVVIRYKQYHWNWLRVTLVANGLLYSGLIIGDLLLSSHSNEASSGFNFVAIAQLLILFFGFYVFGRDQV